MNFYQEKLNQIKVALGVAVKMADAILEDGVTKVEAEAFEPGMKIFVVSETGEKGPAPEGTHTTQEGIKVTVDATGTITAVEKPEPEGEDDVEAGKLKMEDEMPAGGPAPEGDVAMEDVIREKVEEKVSEAMEKVYMAIEEVAKEVGVVKEEMAAYKAKMEKMSKTPAANKIPTYNGDPAEAVSAIEVKLSALNELKKEFASKQRIK